MNEEELKRQTKKRRAVPEAKWAYLKDRGYVDEALELFDEQAVEYIIKEIDALTAASPGGGGRRAQAVRSNRSPETVQVSLGASELARQGALEEYFAMCAACDFDVYRFRKKVLGGQLLSKDQAWDLLKSPAAALVETRFFESWGIPIVGHTAEGKGYPSEEWLPWGRRYVATLTIDPPGITREVSMSPLPAGLHQQERRFLVLQFPDGKSGVANHEVWSVSLLGELREVGEKLHKRYCWHPAEAVWFVLTGETPAVPALTVTRYFPSSMYHHPDRDVLITIEASPWVSSGSVAKAFREAQMKTLGSGAGSSPGEKNLKLLRFVIERTDPLGKLEAGSRLPKTPEDEPTVPEQTPEGEPTEPELIINLRYVKVPEGKELVKEWNEMYPEWSYGGNTKNFWRDFHRIRESVAIGPPYAPYSHVQ